VWVRRHQTSNQSLKPTALGEITSACLPRDPAVAYLFHVRPDRTMQHDYTIHVILHAIVAVGSPVFFGFMALKHHTASRWIRCVFVLLAVVGIAWGILGVLRLGYASHFTRATQARFDHVESVLGGFAPGLLTNLVEFRVLGDQSAISTKLVKRSNQSMKPTAPPRNTFRLFATTPCRGLSPSR